MIYNYKINNNKITITGDESPSVECRIYSKKMHIIMKIIHFILPCLVDSQKILLHDDKFIYTSKKNADKIRNVIKALPINNFDPEFSSDLATRMAQFIRNGESGKLKNLINSVSKKELNKALEAKDSHKQANLLSYAAYVNNSFAVELIGNACDQEQLKKILTLKDKVHWTALHHLALMNDGGVQYRALKKKSEVDTKKVSKFYCESPSMLRKYIKVNPGRFSAEGLKADKRAKLYFRDGAPNSRKEVQLSLEEFKSKHGKLFSHEPEHFKFVPHLTAKFLKNRWKELQKPERDKKGLKKLDAHLKEIYQRGGEYGIAVTTATYDDRGRKIPSNINLGVGSEARKSFKVGDLVTLYGGEYFAEGDFPKGRSGDYSFRDDNLKCTVDGLRFRAYGSTFLHSAPNTKFWEIKSALGINFLAFKAIDKIDSGEMLCVSYGPNYFAARDIVPFEARPAARKKMEQNNNRDGAQSFYLTIKAQNR